MKKVLIISYYWPPFGDIGALRCLKLTKHLRAYGWEPVLFTVENPDYHRIDDSLVNDIPDNMEIIRQKIWEPYALYKKITGKKPKDNVQSALQTRHKSKSFAHMFSVWVRSNFFIPDARAFWIRPSVRRILKYLDNNKIDAIISSGPPHTCTRIATLVAKKTKIPWLADFRDPWTQVDYFKELILMPFGRKKHLKMEQDAFKYANAISVVSESWKNDLEDIGANNVHVAYTGFDDEDYDDAKKLSNKTFSIIHAGLISYDRNPSEFFKVLDEIADENEVFKRTCRVYLYGEIDISIREMVKELRNKELICIRNSIARRDILKQLSESMILLLLLNQQKNTNGRIPGKLFEYLAVRRPILALGKIGSDVDNILNNTQAGELIDYNDRERLKSSILNSFDLFLRNELNSPVQSSIDNYTTKNMAAEIAKILVNIQPTANANR